MKALIVGDPHATVTELEDCEKLLEYVAKIAREQNVNEVIFLGDLYHTHALIHVEVMAFWTKALKKLLATVDKICIIVGNHDMPGNEASTAHALLAQEDIEGVRIISGPYLDESNDVAYLPYIGSKERFVEEAIKLGGRTLVCHQTFDGSLFENGFFAKDGIDSRLLPQQFVISGHIHAPQTFGKVWYPGAPRWRTLSDANADRAIHIIDCGPEANPHVSEAHSTRGVCREIVHVVLRDSVVEKGTLRRVDGRLDPGVDWRIDIYGKNSENENLKAHLLGDHVRIRCFNTETAAVAIKESDGIDVALEKHFEVWRPQYGTAPEVLLKTARERMGWT